MNVKKRVLDWLKEIKEKGEPIEAIGFYQELPIRVKTRLLDFDKNFVQWESEPKLCLAAADDGKLFFTFLDPMYKEKRLLGADVTYYGKSFIETVLPTPSADPRFKRQSLKVRTSKEYPVKFILGGKEFSVRDVSEGGIGLIAEKNSFKRGELIEGELILPFKTLNIKGEVVSIEPVEDKEKFGIKLNMREREKKPLREYVIMRQREILKQIRDIAG